ncbi:MAG: AMP-binding protein [Promethearchaeota archaeon]
MSKNIEITAKTTFNDMVKHKANTIGDKVFLTFVRDFDKGIDEKVTYQDMHSRSNKLGNGLKNFGIGKGSGIALMQINSPEFLYALFATFKLGAYITMINIGLRGDSLQYIIEHSESEVLIIHWSLLERYVSIRDRVSKIKHVIVDMKESPESFNLSNEFSSIESVMEASGEDFNTEINPDEKCMLLYSSGTTGLPKAVTTFYKSYMGLSLGTYYGGLARIMNVTKEDVLFTSLPLFHGNALNLTTLPGYFAEIPIVLGKRFSASRHWDICRKYVVNSFNLLGSMPQYLLKQHERPNDGENKVRVINTAACPKELIEPFEKRFNVKIKEFYGAVDGGGYLLGPFVGEAPTGSMGKPLPGTIGSIMDDNGNILGPNEDGELVFLVKEEEIERRTVSYYKDEKASKSKISRANDGQLWFHTGDLANMDENGWFFFVDRKKDSIRRKGENIAAWSIERVINQHEKVLESAAFGIKSSQIPGEDYAEDEVMVVVVLKPGKTMNPEELLDFIHDKLADFMLPRFIEFADQLPKSEVHRVMKRFLKEKGVTDKTYDREKAK